METYRLDGAAIHVPTTEIYRYLGYRGIASQGAPDPALTERVTACLGRLQAQSTPRSVWTVYDYVPADAGTANAAPASAVPANVQPTDTPPVQNTTDRSTDDGTDAELVRIGSLAFPSANLSRNLHDCTRVVMMAATIGPGVDFLIRRAEATSMLDAAIYQAAGAAMVEAWCDLVNERIKCDMAAQGLYARPRFSPGYGDVPLTLPQIPIWLLLVNVIAPFLVAQEVVLSI